MASASNVPGRGTSAAPGWARTDGPDMTRTRMAADPGNGRGEGNHPNTHMGCVGETGKSGAAAASSLSDASSYASSYATGAEPALAGGRPTGPAAEHVMGG